MLDLNSTLSTLTDLVHRGCDNQGCPWSSANATAGYWYLAATWRNWLCGFVDRFECFKVLKPVKAQ
jgi:hypothetical protein